MKHNIGKTKKPWPTKKAMEQIYDLNLWGGGETDFYSGNGSHDPQLIVPYLKTVISFLTSFQQPLTVCDLGCGDFNIGKKLVPSTKKYIAVDIVEDLIAYNRQQFKADHLEFQCLDISKDDLPKADCAILRQVLQHLSNEEIQHIVTKLANYKYVILTEHLPEGNFIPNAAIISGQGIRLKKHSGIDVLATPFNFQVKERKHLLSQKMVVYKGVLVTTLYTVF